MTTPVEKQLRVGDVVPDSSGRKLNPVGFPCLKFNRSLKDYNKKYGLNIKEGDLLSVVKPMIEAKAGRKRSDMLKKELDIKSISSSSSVDSIDYLFSMKPRFVFVF